LGSHYHWNVMPSSALGSVTPGDPDSGMLIAAPVGPSGGIHNCAACESPKESNLTLKC